ncbi:MAG TPA: low molecular weight protein-tyrosine-phosphatase [Symbiobacteriaceae bacterium]|nr:low molecular weight protein-tyrosine-phosphatase [Symbiobacteriaceae bacterium]
MLFVCLGNICRSPMAEGVFRHLVREAGLADRITVDSAGTGAYHIGEPPHHGTRRVLKERGIDDTGLVARQVKHTDLEQFEYIIAMDQANAADLERLRRSGGGNRVHLLTDFVPDAPVKDVPDPWYTGNFEAVYDLVDAGCRGLLARIQSELE